MRPPRVVSSVGVALVLGLGLAPPTAWADPGGVREGLAAYQQGALSEAMAAFERALERGDNDRAALATIYLHLGVLRAGARDPSGAVRAFAALLSLDPAARPPAGSSPLVTEPFEEAQDERAAEPRLAADVRLGPRVERGATLAVDVAVRGDRAGMAHEARAATPSGASAAATGAPPFRLTLPGSATADPGRLTVRVTLHDEHGSTLDASEVSTEVVAPARAQAAPRPAIVAPPPEHTPARREGGSVLSSGWFWAGAALVVAGGVTTAVLLTAGDDRASFGAIEVRR